MSLPLFARSRQEPAHRSPQIRTGAGRGRARRNPAHIGSRSGGRAGGPPNASQPMAARARCAPSARSERADLEIASYSAGRASLADAIEARPRSPTPELTVLDREALVAADSVRLTITFRERRSMSDTTITRARLVTAVSALVLVAGGVGFGLAETWHVLGCRSNGIPSPAEEDPLLV